MIIDQINQVNSSDYPFSHYWGTEFWTDEFYSKLVDSLPPTEQYESFWHKDAMTEYGSTRYRLILDDKGIKQFKQEDRTMWGDLVESLRSKQFRRAVFEKLKTDIIATCGSIKVSARPEVLLYRDLSGYKILPHCDKRKIVTTQFYLPKDNSIEEVGTELYTKDGDNFPIYKKMKFLPRHGYGFAVSNKSWHGVSTISKDNIVRDSLMVIYYTI